MLRAASNFVLTKSSIVYAGSSGYESVVGGLQAELLILGSIRKTRASARLIVGPAT